MRDDAVAIIVALLCDLRGRLLPSVCSCVFFCTLLCGT